MDQVMKLLPIEWLYSLVPPEYFISLKLFIQIVGCHTSVQSETSTEHIKEVYDYYEEKEHQENDSLKLL